MMSNTISAVAVALALAGIGLAAVADPSMGGQDDEVTTASHRAHPGDPYSSWSPYAAGGHPLADGFPGYGFPGVPCGLTDEQQAAAQQQAEAMAEQQRLYAEQQAQFMAEMIEPQRSWAAELPQAGQAPVDPSGDGWFMPAALETPYGYPGDTLPAGRAYNLKARKARYEELRKQVEEKRQAVREEHAKRRAARLERSGRREL